MELNVIHVQERVPVVQDGRVSCVNSHATKVTMVTDVNSNVFVWMEPHATLLRETAHVHQAIKEQGMELESFHSYIYMYM